MSSVVVVEKTELLALIQAAVREALGEEVRAKVQLAEGLSAKAAALLAHKRKGDVHRALENGALEGQWDGRRWRILPDAVQEWIRAGTPIEKTTRSA